MKLQVRGRLFLASLAVVGVVIAVAGLVAHLELRRWFESRTEEELARKLAAAGLVVATASPATPSRETAQLASALGAALGVRVSLINHEGVVVGDSEVSAPAALAALDNHAQRPEVRAALAGVQGRDRRLSTTLHEDMLYLASPWPPVANAGVPGLLAANGGVVRVASSYADVDEAAARLRWLLLFAGAMGLLAAIVMSALASQLLSRTLRQLVERARSLVGDRFGDDEIGSLAGTLQQLGDDLGRAMGTLAAERDRFAAVLEAMNEGVVGLDAGGRVVFVNTAARALLGGAAPAKLAVGKSLLELVRVPALDNIARAALAGTASDVEVELYQPAKALRVRAGPVRAGGAVLVLHDVSDMRRLERVRRDFVANVSHELRTPVSVIRANAETLLLGALDDRGRAVGFLEAIDRNAERLTRLVGDLLDLSRIEVGQVTLHEEALPVRLLAQHAVEAVEGRARERGQVIVVEVDEGLRVRADAKALDQVLVNLLDNAVKYTPPGGHIRVRAVAAGEHVRIEIEDDGPGIEAKHRARLFERFYRVDPGRSRDAGGTGLGLAIVKHLVEAMGGAVGVGPAPERGSIFFVELRAEIFTATSPR